MGNTQTMPDVVSTRFLFPVEKENLSCQLCHGVDNQLYLVYQRLRSGRFVCFSKIIFVEDWSERSVLIGTRYKEKIRTYWLMRLGNGDLLVSRNDGFCSITKKADKPTYKMTGHRQMDKILKVLE